MGPNITIKLIKQLVKNLPNVEHLPISMHMGAYAMSIQIKKSKSAPKIIII
jgi:hypothetical protein